MIDPRILQQAEQQLRSGRPAEARSLLLQALASHPGDASVLRGLAATSAALGDIDGTIGYFRQLVKRSPRPLAVLDEMGRYCVAHGRAGVAVEAYERHLASHPDSAVAHFNCAWYATRAGRHEFAIEHYVKSLALGIDRPEEVHLNIANLCSGPLRDDARASTDVLEYLRAEDAYRVAMTAAWKPLEDQLYREIVGRIRQDDSSVPYRDNGWWYLHRYDTGDEYPVYARRAGSAAGPEQVLLDLREHARGDGAAHPGIPGSQAADLHPVGRTAGLGRAGV